MGAVEDELRRLNAASHEQTQSIDKARTQYQKNLAEFRDLMVKHSIEGDHAYNLRLSRRQVAAKMGFLVAKEPAYEAVTCDFTPGASGWVIDHSSDSDTGKASGTILTADLRLFVWEKFDEKWNAYSRQKVEYPSLGEHDLRMSAYYFGKDSRAVMILGKELPDPADYSPDAGAAKLARQARIYLTGAGL
jgi:hypothetical protein